MPERRKHIGIIYSYSNSYKSITYFLWQILSLAGIWSLDLPSTKPMGTQEKEKEKEEKKIEINTLQQFAILENCKIKLHIKDCGIVCLRLN